MNARELLRGWGVPFAEAGEHHHVSEGWLGLDCPRCSPRWGHYRLGYSLAGHYLSCWVCGHLPLIATVAELAGLHPGKVAEGMRGIVRSLPRRRPRGRLELPDGLGPLGPLQEAYLRGRGFDPPALRRLWRVKSIGWRGGPVAHRVFIPVHLRGEIVSWTARACVEGVRKKYHNAAPQQEAYPAKELLYGADHARHAVVVHEGPTDVWRTGPGAVATLGVAYTAAQLALIARYPVRAVCFDSEPEAQRRARRLCDDLACFPGQTHLVRLDAPDPGSAGPGEVRRLRRAFLE